MPDNTTAAGTTAPAATQTITTDAAHSATPAATPQQGATQAPSPDGSEPHWLKPRLERETRAAREALLKQMGVGSIEDAMKVFDELRKRDDANKSADVKAAELAKDLDAERAAAKRLADTLAEHAGRQMLALTTEQQRAVKAIAGDDAAAQLRAIDALQPTWAAVATAAAAAVTTTPATAPAVTTTAKPPPATTAPAAGAPNGATTTTPDHRAQYAELKSKNPFAAAKFGAEHPEVYESKH